MESTGILVSDSRLILVNLRNSGSLPRVMTDFVGKGCPICERLTAFFSGRPAPIVAADTA